MSKKFLISLFLFPFLVWGLLLFYYNFINSPNDYFGFAGVIELPIILLSCIFFAIIVAKKTGQSIIKSIIIILPIFLIAPLIVSLPLNIIRDQTNGLAQKGLQTNNPYYCQLQIKLSPSYTTRKPGNECLIKLAINNKDISICDAIKSTEFKINCYTSMAYKYNDPALCDKMTSIIREERGKKDEIDYLEDTAYCLTQLALDNNNILACDLIKIDGYKARCYQNLAYKNNDSSICEKLTGIVWEPEKFSYGDNKDCYNNDGRISCSTADVCYNELAIKNKDASLCSLINDETSKYFCLLNTK